MANSLLDFVMSLVRDPEIAARYDADPAQAIADAGLDDVTSADVANLVPLVSESVSMVAPIQQADNIWASGAATSAFDAFGAIDAVEAPAFDRTISHDSVIHADVGPGADPLDHETFGDGYDTTGVDDSALTIDDAAPDAADAPGVLPVDLDDLRDAVIDADPADDSFDIFS
ncbi:Rv0340 family IniB-related protein [Mycobacterium sp. 236(2023)]|uniref:Rv0340 family IniB-related protein n=1 Tax=Mycobacterium sp. 236(2023) TaxID=3038163 RepID=UPI002414D5D3|nr:Rv0340 family IniB-related protein [Mycobacterium sp. 236(2023)]MDG4663260.1 Rv0340 family protein [Mycobacterium sp. 236(2023)]